MRTIINVYKTYEFKNKDPIIDEIRTIINDQYGNNISDNAAYKNINEGSGVSVACLQGWFKGSTRRPQNPTVEAVVRYLGYERRLVKVGPSPATAFKKRS